VKKVNDLKGKKVAMIIASKNFRDEEYLQPKDVLSKAGAEIVTVSSTLDQCTGILGAKVKPDVLISEMKASEYDAVIFVGGHGSSEYWDSAVAHKIVKDTVSHKKILAAICIAPSTLANAGVIQGKNATAFPSVSSHMESKGAKYTGKPVEQDGKIITGYGPEAALEFGEAVKRLLMMNRH